MTETDFKALKRKASDHVWGATDNADEAIFVAILDALDEADRLLAEHREMVIGVEMAMVFCALHPGDIAPETIASILPARLRATPERKP